MSVDRPPEARSADPAKSARLLEVPHPGAADRLFVLAPLSDLAPRLVPPGWTESVASARRRRKGVEGTHAVRPVASWDDARGWLASAQ
jgi:7,8-dihydro-6-hydroxymethylpterin-pyrophosphokinase